MTGSFARPARPLPEETRPPRLPLISDYPRYWATRTPDAEAVVLGEVRWRYPELAERIDRCAKGLLTAGVTAGTRVATLSPPHPDFLVTFLAAASIGAIWLGLNPRYQRRELEYASDDADPALLFARTTIGGRDYRDDIAALARQGRRVVLLDEPAGADSWPAFLAGADAVPDASLAHVRAAVRPTDPCLIVYTSGTTGAPKGALIHHHGLVAVARVQHAVWPVHPIRVINNLPINHIGCVGDISCDTIVPGGTIVFDEQFDPGRMLDLVERERITLFGHVPTALQLIVTHPRFAATDFSSVQLIIWEGAAAPPDLVAALRGKCPEVANAYGMTETVGSVTFTFDSDDPGVLCDSVGWPAPEYEVRIANDGGTAVPPGTPGEVQVRGDFLTPGYWRRPDATAALFAPGGWLCTGDLAVERADGAYRLIGRLTEMFKSGGYNVYPREIELVLEAHPDVAMAAVIGVADPLYQEVGHAFVLPHPGRQPSVASLEAHCRGALANYKIPKRFTIEVEFPLLPIGKIDKQSLRRLAE